MIFKSQQVNLDPLGGMCHCGTDVADHDVSDNHSPVEVRRPQFEPTRDPYPWVNTFGNRVLSPGRTDDGEFTWAPRRELYDTPVNRILVSVREGLKHRVGREQELIALWLGNLAPISNPAQGFGVTQFEVEHARKVLRKLAA